jgi:hypothetical protein
MAEVRRAAIRMQSGLQDAAKKLKNEHVLADLTRDEAVAFSYWDACALERLRFVRDYYPTAYPPGRLLVDSNHHVKLQGMMQTSVLDFAKEYRQYLFDREGFIGRRPNYIGLVDAIVKANTDIIKAPDSAAIIAALKALGTLTTAVEPAAVTLSKTTI